MVHTTPLRCFPRITTSLALILWVILTHSSVDLAHAQMLPSEHWDMTNQYRTYVHDSWNTSHGLPQNIVTAINQTPDGYLWLGTQNGLARFNSVTFKTFDRYNTQAIRNEFIRRLAVGKDSALWIGTDHGGVLSLRDGIFTAHVLAESLAVEGTRMVTVTRDSTVWAAIPGLGVWRTRGANWERVADLAQFKSVYAAFEDNDGSIWLGEKGELVHLIAQTVVRYGAAQGIPAVQIHSIIRDSRGNLLIGTWGSGILSLQKNRAIPLAGGAGFQRSMIHSLCNGPEGGVWIGSYDEGLLHYDGTTIRRCIVEDPRSRLHVGPVFVDNEGSIWFGTAGDGVHRLRKGIVRYLQFNEPGISSQVWAVLPRGDELWVGTRSNGLRRFAGGSFQRVASPAKLATSTVCALMETGDGSLLVACEEGLFRWTEKGTTEILMPSGESFSNVYALLKDRKGTAWIGAQGLFRLSGNSTSLYPGMPPGFSVNYLLEDSKGNLWIGTDANGVGVISNGKVTFSSTDQGLRSNTILCLFEDSQGGIWCGTQGGGLSRQQDGRWNSLTVSTGLPDNYINSIIRGQGNTLWMSTNRGLFGVAESTLIAAATHNGNLTAGIFIGRQDGLQSTEFGGGLQTCSAQSADGTLWFVSIKGLVGVDPAVTKRLSLPPPVRIEKIQVDGDEKEMRDGMTVGPGIKSLAFSYVGLTYILPSATHYQYRLEGLNEDWIDGREQREATFANLSPGTYVFHVRAENSGILSANDATLRFTILPLFWQTSWFKMISVLLFVLLVYAGFRVRVRGMLKREQMLKQRIADAVADIKVLHGLIPICANCKKVRDDKGYWNDVAQYITENSQAVMTHGICPECTEKLYGREMLDRIRKKRGDAPAE